MLPCAENIINIYSDRNGSVKKIDAEKLGIASMLLGGGRTKKEDTIDYGVGVIIHKKVSDMIGKGDLIATIHANSLENIEAVKAIILEAYDIKEEVVLRPTLIYGILK